MEHYLLTSSHFKIILGQQTLFRVNSAFPNGPLSQYSQGNKSKVPPVVLEAPVLAGKKTIQRIHGGLNSLVAK